MTHTTPAINRAARAIVEQEGILDWDTLGENLRDYPRDLARAALAAALEADIAATIARHPRVLHDDADQDTGCACGDQSAAGRSWAERHEGHMKHLEAAIRSDFLGQPTP